VGVAHSGHGGLFTLADTSQTHTADSSPTAPSTRRQGPPAPPHRLTRPRRCHGPTYREKARAGGGPAGRRGRGLGKGLGLAHTPHMRHVTSESGLPHAHPRGARVSSPWQRRVGGLLKVNFESRNLKYTGADEARSQKSNTSGRRARVLGRWFIVLNGSSTRTRPRTECAYNLSPTPPQPSLILLDSLTP
jgi:hypothetical protein